jgi:glutamyl-tRNA reductase
MGEGLSEKQRKSIEAMGRAIVNKLLHEPTSRLRAVGTTDEGNQLAGAAAELFGLNDEPVNPLQPPARKEAPNVVASGGK